MICTVRLPPFLLLTILPMVNCQLAIESTDVNNFVKGFVSYSQRSVDVLKELGRFKKGLPIMLSLAGPVGTFIATVTDAMLSESESAEVKALNLLHETVKNEFKNINQRFVQLYDDAEFAALLREYNLMVNLKIEYIRTMFEDLTNSSLLGNTKSRYISLCNDRSASPLNVLQYLDNLANKHCNVPTIKDADIFASSKSTFLRYEEGDYFSDHMRSDDEDNNGNYSSYLQFKTDAIAFLVEQSLENAKQKLSGMEAVISRRKNDLQLIDLERSLNMPSAGYRNAKRDEYFGCLLKTTALKFDYRRQNLLDIAAMIANDLLQLIPFSSVCAKLETPNLEHNLNRYHSLITGILGKSEELLRQYLITSWPYAFKHAATKGMGKEDITAKKYEDILKKIAESFKQIGLMEYRYQLVMFPDWDSNYYSEGCKADTCYLIEQQKKVNLFITRFDDRGLEHAVKANELFNSMKTEIDKSIRERAITGKVAKQQLVNSFVNTQYFYRNALLIHNSMYFEGACKEIPVEVEEYYFNWKDDAQRIKKTAGYNQLLVHVDSGINIFANEQCFLIIFLI